MFFNVIVGSLDLVQKWYCVHLLLHLTQQLFVEGSNKVSVGLQFRKLCHELGW